MLNGKEMGCGGRFGGGRGFAGRLHAAPGHPIGGDDGRVMGDGRFGGGRPGGRRGGGGGRRRLFDGGELRLVLLQLIADKPRHGYDLIRAMEERTGGGYVPSPGVVYPTLTLLTEMGFVQEQVSDGARKLFEVTAEGSAHLAERAKELEAIFARLDAIGEMRERTDVAPIRRAVHNLRNVLDNRLGAGLDDARLHDAVALIDEVARKIERL